MGCPVLDAVLLLLHPTHGAASLVGSPHSYRIRGGCLVPRPENAVLIRGSGSKRVGVPFKVGSRPGLRGVATPLLTDLIGIRRIRIVDQCGFY